MLYTSLAFILYYFAMSFALYLHPARLATRHTGTPARRSA